MNSRGSRNLRLTRSRRRHSQSGIACLETLSATVRVERPALDELILPEVVRRSTERVPPCDHAGKEVRDTIIWLSLLSYCRSLPADAEVAFLTLNTKDFASADGTDLRIELAHDVAQLTQAVTFFPSLDAFNKVHAERVAYLTVEWIREKLGGTLGIAELVDAYVRAVDADAFFRIGSSEYEDYYQPGEVADVLSVMLS